MAASRSCDQRRFSSDCSIPRNLVFDPPHPEAPLPRHFTDQTFGFHPTKVREAANEAELQAAILGAGTIDVTRSNCPMEAAMRWAESADEAPGDLSDEFSHKVDLEAASEPEATETRGERLRVRRVVRGRVRVRN